MVGGDEMVLSLLLSRSLRPKESIVPVRLNFREARLRVMVVDGGAFPVEVLLPSPL